MAASDLENEVKVTKNYSVPKSLQRMHPWKFEKITLNCSWDILQPWCNRSNHISKSKNGRHWPWKQGYGDQNLIRSTDPPKKAELKIWKDFIQRFLTYLAGKVRHLLLPLLSRKMVTVTLKVWSYLKTWKDFVKWFSGYLADKHPMRAWT